MYKKIGLNEPSINNNEIILAKKCIKSTWLSTSGKLIDNFEKKISKFTKSKYCIAVNSGTSALHISLILADVKADDEVLVPSLTFIAPVNCIRYVNANPVFMDCDENFNLDIEKTIEFINNKTFYKNNFSYNLKTKKKIIAIIVVHVWGNAVKLDFLVDLCRARNIKIIEDSSESLGTFFKEGRYKKKHTGTIGFCGVLSFNGNKIITTGNGGMILTNNNKISKRAKYLISQSKDNSFKYIHNEIGYNYRLSNLSASIGLSQIDKIKDLLISKKKIYLYYLSEISKIKGLKLLKNPQHSNSNNWLNIIIIEKNYKHSISYLTKKFNQNNIEVRPVWYANHLQKHLKKFQRYRVSNTTFLIKKSLCLPSSSFLTKKNLDTIINCLK